MVAIITCNANERDLFQRCNSFYEMTMISINGPLDPFTILSHLPVALMVLDSVTREVLLLNDRFNELFGYSEDDIRLEDDWWPVAFPDKHYRDYVAREWDIRVGWAKENNCEMEPLEAVIRCKDGQECSVRTHLAAHKGMDIVTLIDISDQKLLLKKYETLASTDPLTGLANRRSFFSALEQHIALATRYLRPLSVVIADIDHFKVVNDSYGHQAGDTVLAHFAHLMKRCMRTSDIAARIGGEEFAILLPETSGHGACCLAERIRTTVVENICYYGGMPIHTTVSLGLASLSGGEPAQPTPTCDEFLHLADDALYSAKREGRNRVNLLEYKYL